MKGTGMSIHEPDQRRSYDEVEFRASRDGNSIAIQLSRATAEAKAEELRDEGWDIEIIEVDTQRGR
jgi:hypothetical protein